MNTIELIQTLIEKQKKLNSNLCSQSDDGLDDINLRYLVPDSIRVGRQEWTTQVHGIGVLFKNINTGEVIDMHVGVIDAPDVFDTWRILQYYESITGIKQDYASWEKILAALATEGVILPHPKYPRHYVMK